MAKATQTSSFAAMMKQADSTTAKPAASVLQPDAKNVPLPDGKNVALPDGKNVALPDAKNLLQTDVQNTSLKDAATALQLPKAAVAMPNPTITTAPSADANAPVPNSDAITTAIRSSGTIATQQVVVAAAVPLNETAAQPQDDKIAVQPQNNPATDVNLAQDAAAEDVPDSKDIGTKLPVATRTADARTKSPAHHKSADGVPNATTQSAPADPDVTTSIALTQVVPQMIPFAKPQDLPAKDVGDVKTSATKAGLVQNVVTNAAVSAPAPQVVSVPAMDAPAKSVAASGKPPADAEANDDADGEEFEPLFADKMGAAGGTLHSNLLNIEPAMPAAASTGASFRFSLQEVAPSSHPMTHSTVHEAVQASTFTNDVSSLPQAMPAVRHLEVAVNDPILGNVGVRAEMRNGALHASISGAVNEVASAAPALHQYLQQHNVELHSVSFTAPVSNDARVQQVNAAATTSFSGGMDSSSSNGSGAQPQQQGAHTAVPEWKSAFADDSGYNVNGFMTSRVPAAATTSMRAGSTLSIHI